MYKLLMRAFPGWYRANSIYALYPFNTPARMKEIFAKNGIPHNIAINYDAPAFINSPIPIATWQGVVDVLHDQQRFQDPREPISCTVLRYDGSKTDNSNRGPSHPATRRSQLYESGRQAYQRQAARVVPRDNIPSQGNSGRSAQVL